MRCLTNCTTAVTEAFCRLFYGWGRIVSRRPVPFILLPIAVCAVLGYFFLHAETRSDMEEMYTPLNSRARADRARVKELFPDNTGDHFSQISANDHPQTVSIILCHRDTSSSLAHQHLDVLRDVGNQIRNLSVVTDVIVVLPENVSKEKLMATLAVTSEGYVTGGSYISEEDYRKEQGDDVKIPEDRLVTIERLVTWNDVCARLKNKCQIEGLYLISDEFQEAYENGTIHFPYWDSPWGPIDLTRTVGNVDVGSTGLLLSAGAFRLTFNLRGDTPHQKALASAWEKNYLRTINDLDFGSLDYAYASANSLGEELHKGTKGDIRIFSFTFTLMIVYASVVTSGGDCVSSRSMLARGGVLAAVLGIFGALGLVSLAGVPFVNIVGTMPFLVLGIGVDDMFLLMASWSGTLGNTGLSVPERLGSTFRSAGVGITITSVTDGIAFAVGGVFAEFQSVRNFCIYTGTAVMLCYICNLTFFGGCMALHGRRVYSSRHNVTCRKLKSREELREEGRSACFACCCGGSIPDREGGDESVCEKLPRLLLPKIVLWAPMKFIIIILFGAFLGVSIWAAMGLQQGLLLKNLVLPSSFYYKYNTFEEDNFGVTFPVSFVIEEPLDYSNITVATDVMNLLRQAREDEDVSVLGSHCWLSQYFLSMYFDPSSPAAFIKSLKENFFVETPEYIGDVNIDDNDVIVASRCHVLSRNVKDSIRQAQLMQRMRAVADAAPFRVFAYQPAFVFFEQYLTIVPNTLYTVGVTLATMAVVTLIMLAHPLMVLLVLLNVAMIVTGIFGFMTLWGLTLSSVTMIHLIMSVGFSVDFSAHVCASYMTSKAPTRQARAYHALTHASGPIFNGALSSFVGIVVLIFSESYIFSSFFKIMVLVILFGMMHAVFLMPVVLSLIGPELSKDVADWPGMSAEGNKAHTGGNKTPGSNGGVSAIAWSTPSDGKDSLEAPGPWLGNSGAFDNKAFTTHL